MTPAHWAMVAESCKDDPFMERADVATLLDSGDAYAFWTHDAVLVCEMLDIPSNGNRILSVLVAGGKLDDIIPGLMSDAEDFARLNGCTHCHAGGRRGWQRALAPHGYTDMAVNLLKAL